MSRQKRYQVIQFRLGNCVNCGDLRGDSVFKRICAACGEARKAKRRKKLGSRPWQLGAPGRPPLASQIETQEEGL